tara:strand:+ start:561 stop:746 length:186 start_codon:yes stop_codon:yes gene_type:complete
MDTNVTTRPVNSGEKALKTIDEAPTHKWKSWELEKDEPNNEHRTTSVGINNMGLAFALINN